MVEGRVWLERREVPSGPLVPTSRSHGMAVVRDIRRLVVGGLRLDWVPKRSRMLRWKRGGLEMLRIVVEWRLHRGELRLAIPRDAVVGLRRLMPEVLRGPV